ncbi:MAG TPA: glycosyltransferase family 2 protein [Myxococcales bacterium]|nr:glycosyltransferase family 2 protein [Myxococcales bacterium]
MPKLSVAVIACDEERDLPRCLASVRFADERVVVDSGSRDRTRELAREAGARVVEQPFLGYGKQKAFALAQTTGDWVLALDADEAVTPELAAEIPQALERPGIDGYRLRFRSRMFGRTLRFGGARHETHLRLFRRTAGRYDERTIHEGVTVEGRVETLGGFVEHSPYASLSEYLVKLERYSTLAAEQRHAAGRRFSKTAAARLPWGFFRRYVLWLGALDGYAGFVAASLGAMSDFLKEAKLQDLERP